MRLQDLNLSPRMEGEDVALLSVSWTSLVSPFHQKSQQDISLVSRPMKP